MSDRTDKRTTISLADVVWQMAEAQMSVKGFNENFSSYVADLIRRDRDRTLYAEQLALREDPTVQPLPASQPVSYRRTRKNKP